MKNPWLYRGAYFIIGIFFALLVTQSALNDRAQLWILVAYIVLGGFITEVLRKKAGKKKEHRNS
ncbi:hypothetical protein M4S82_16025 [Planococcus sp. MERTA32b]|nr:hypothetical protein [Planococcus sp. MER TA 32b]